MDWHTAKRGVELLLKTKGKKKLLKIYGGEPLLNFPLIKKIVPHAEKLALKYGKELTVTICSNMVLFNAENLKFIKKHEVSLALSSDGKPESHNLNRRFKTGKESAGIIESKLELLLEKVSKEKLAINLTVPNELVSELFENFKYLTALGANTFNVEPIMSDAWKKQEIVVFRRQFQKILDWVIASAEKGNFIFITQINRELRYGEITEMMQGSCILKRNLILSTIGELHLNVFAAYSEEDRAEKCVGNVNTGIFSKHFGCKNKQAEVCERCLAEYAKNLKKINAPSGTRNELTLQAVRELKRRAKSQLIYRKYLSQAKKQICF